MGNVQYQRFFRTDLGREYYWDGTRWLSMQVFSFEHYSGNSTAGGVSSGAQITATTSLLQRWPVWGGQDIFVRTFHLSVLVNTGGTPLDGANNWTVGFHKTAGLTTTNNFATRTINSLPAGAAYGGWWKVASGSIDALLGTTIDMVSYGVVKAGTPGSLHLLPRLTWQLVG